MHPLFSCARKSLRVRFLLSLCVCIYIYTHRLHTKVWVRAKALAFL